MKCRYEGCAEQATHNAIGYQGFDNVDSVYQMCKTHAFEVDHLAEPIQKQERMNDIDKRLENIEKRWCPNYADIQWLVDSFKDEREARRTAEYQWGIRGEQLQAEREEKERLEKALLFYANGLNFSYDEIRMPEVLADGGEQARSALGGDRE